MGAGDHRHQHLLGQQRRRVWPVPSSTKATLTVTNSTFAGNTTPSYGGAITEQSGDRHHHQQHLLGEQRRVRRRRPLQPVRQHPHRDGHRFVADSSTGSDCWPNGAFTDSALQPRRRRQLRIHRGPGDLSDTPSGLDPTGLENNGGPTKTIALEPGSAAIGDVSDGSLCPATDQRGCHQGHPLRHRRLRHRRPTHQLGGLRRHLRPPTVTVSGSGIRHRGRPRRTDGGRLRRSRLRLRHQLRSCPTTGWTAGQGPGDCIGLIISSYSDSQITFTLGRDTATRPLRRR